MDSPTKLNLLKKHSKAHAQIFCSSAVLNFFQRTFTTTEKNPWFQRIKNIPSEKFLVLSSTEYTVHFIKSTKYNF